MEFSQVFGGPEECNSSESGWTTYIGSPSPEKDHNGDEDDNHRIYKQGDYKKHHYGDDCDDGNSDDSMASDASSGPSHYEGACGSHLRDFGKGKFKHARGNYCSNGEILKQVKKGEERRSSVGKRESVPRAKTAANHIQSGAQKRKTN